MLVIAEATLNFIIPTYYGINPPPRIRNDPYAGAPYVDFLKTKSSDEYRIFSRDGLLSADWAAAFGLYDIRDFDALYPREYLRFVRNFVGDPSDAQVPDLLDQFTGMDKPEKYSFSTALKRRLLQLSSVKYLAATRAFGNAAEGPGSFKLIYNRDASIYEYDDVLSRAGIFYQTDIEPGASDVLSRLRDPKLNIMTTVVVAAPDLDQKQRDALAGMNGTGTRTVEPAKITSYQPMSVDIEAPVDRNAILVLNDTAYPGWKVSVDNKTENWFRANYLFRGVLLVPGRHHIRFAYRPLSFYLGACISLATLLIVGLAGWLQARRLSPAP
jgi:hypothetical protein